MTRLFVLNGPNLGRLGTREPDVYGSMTHDELDARCVRLGTEIGVEVEVRQTDSEGEFIGWLHEAADLGASVVLNAGAWTHYSVAVRDAAAQLSVPWIELHVSNVYAREQFRHHSVLSDLATGVIAGFGVDGYDMALRWLASRTR